MALTLSHELRLVRTTAFVNTLSDGSTVTSTGQPNVTAVTLTNGTGANKAQVQWQGRVTLAGAANSTLDLAALTAGAFAGTIAMSKIKSIEMQMVTLTTGVAAEIGGAASNAFSAFAKDPSDIVVLGAGGVLVWTNPVDGWTVDGTHKSLKLTNAHATVAISVDIQITGEGTLA